MTKFCRAFGLRNSRNILLGMLLIVANCGLMELSFAADIQFQWDLVNDAGVDGYELDYGKAQGGPYDTGSVQVNGSGTSTTTVSETRPGTYYAAVRACGSCGTASVAYSPYSNEVSFTVASAANQPPTVTNPGAQSGTAGGSVSLNISASDNNGDTLVYSATGLPPGLSINSNSGLISGTLASGSAGTYGVTVVVNDGSAQASASFSWTVLAANNSSPSTGGTADSDNDGVSDSTDSAPLDPKNSGEVIALLEHDTDPGEYGNSYGDSSYYTVFAATFQGGGSDKLLHVQGYDIDRAQEVAVYVNSTLLGYLSPGPNNALNTSSLWWLPAALQVDGENRIEFVESNPGWGWGVTNLGLYAPGSAFGNMKTLPGGDTSHAIGFEVHLPESAVGYLLELTGYDIDGGAGVGLDLNGTPLVDLPAGNDNDWSQSGHLVLPADWLSAGDNVLLIKNLQNQTNVWGLRLDRLLPLNAELGNNLPGQLKADYRPDAVRYLIPPHADDSIFNLSFYDVDNSVELALLQDDVDIGYADTTADDAWGGSQGIVIPAGQRTLLEVNNTFNPPKNYVWGVRLQ